jgi:hypothetical protein
VEDAFQREIIESNPAIILLPVYNRKVAVYRIGARKCSGQASTKLLEMREMFLHMAPALIKRRCGPALIKKLPQ